MGKGWSQTRVRSSVVCPLSLSWLTIRFSLALLCHCCNLPCLGLSTSVSLFLFIHAVDIIASLWFYSILAILCQGFFILMRKISFGPYLYCDCHFPPSVSCSLYLLFLCSIFFLPNIYLQWGSVIIHYFSSSFAPMSCSVTTSQAVCFSFPMCPLTTELKSPYMLSSIHTITRSPSPRSHHLPLLSLTPLVILDHHVLPVFVSELLV